MYNIDLLISENTFTITTGHQLCLMTGPLYFIYKIISSLFGEETQIRFRPSYFPFTEPSAEVDILSKDKKWLEILGCGVINPIVLENCNIDPKSFSGLAFGLGVERIAMLKYGVKDIRDFYKSNLDFLKQFK